jgi:hypothetical protein
VFAYGRFYHVIGHFGRQRMSMNITQWAYEWAYPQLSSTEEIAT